MVKGLVLVSLTAGKERAAIEAIKKLQGVKGAIGVFGSWDAIATAQADSLETLASVVVGKIKATSGVANAETLIEVEI